MYYVYVLECRDETFYTGITWSLKKRIKEHNCGQGALFTKSRLPVRLVYFESFKNKHKAALREKVVKDMSQKKKRRLIEKFILSDNEKFTSNDSEKRG